MEKIQVVIADDNIQFRNILKEYLNNQEDMNVIGVAKDGWEAINQIKTKSPDIVLLDIIMPQLDGLGVLEKIQVLPMEKRPVFIMLSAIGQDKITQKALNFGAEYYIIKPIDMDTLVTRIRQLNETSNSIVNKPCLQGVKVSENSNLSTENHKIKVTEIMRKIGIPANLKGYQFIRCAVLIVLKDPEAVNYITKQVYPEIAKNFNTTPSRVERSIRHAIEVTWTRGQKETIRALFSHNDGKKRPTNSEFIATLSDKLQLEI